MIEVQDYATYCHQKPHFETVERPGNWLTVTKQYVVYAQMLEPFTRFLDGLTDNLTYVVHDYSPILIVHIHKDFGDAADVGYLFFWEAHIPK